MLEEKNGGEWSGGEQLSLSGAGGGRQLVFLMSSGRCCLELPRLPLGREMRVIDYVGGLFPGSALMLQIDSFTQPFSSFRWPGRYIAIETHEAINASPLPLVQDLIVTHNYPTNPYPASLLIACDGSDSTSILERLLTLRSSTSANQASSKASHCLPCVTCNYTLCSRKQLEPTVSLPRFQKRLMFEHV